MSVNMMAASLRCSSALIFELRLFQIPALEPPHTGGRDIATYELGEEIAALHLGAEYRRPGFALQYFLESFRWSSRGAVSFAKATAHQEGPPTLVTLFSSSAPPRMGRRFWREPHLRWRRDGA